MNANFNNLIVRTTLGFEGLTVTCSLTELFCRILVSIGVK